MGIALKNQSVSLTLMDLRVRVNVFDLEDRIQDELPDTADVAPGEPSIILFKAQEDKIGLFNGELNCFLEIVLQRISNWWLNLNFKL